MTEKFFRERYWENEEFRKNLETFLVDFFDEGEECDGEEVEGDLGDWLYTTCGERFCTDSGVEKVCFYQCEWKYLYKIQVNTVGYDYDDFSSIWSLADDAGYGSLFCDVTDEGTFGNYYNATRQERVEGDFIRGDVIYNSLSNSMRDFIDESGRTPWGCEDVVGQASLVYGEDFAMKFADFLNDNGIGDIHCHNFMVVNGNAIRIFDASFS